MPIEIILLTVLIIAAVTVCAARNLLVSVITFASFSVIMSIVWVLMAAPDLAVTETAVGAGISSLLLFVVLKRIQAMEDQEQLKNEHHGWSAEENKTGM